jgi:hypothetical protein
MTKLTEGVCGYSSASAALGSRNTSAYFSMTHPHTCYMQTYQTQNVYDGGCNAGDVTGVGTQYMMNFECDGVWHSSGWLDTADFDGWCGLDHTITGCEFRSRAPGCLK